MTYYSLNRKAEKVGFKEAVIRGLAPDKGLYFPESIEPLDASFWEGIKDLSKEEIAYKSIRQFVKDDIDNSTLETILTQTLSFDFPLVRLNHNISFLELFHGPTMAFKDVGARFMARCLGHFNKNESDEVTVLVATSGDTGGAVANGFLGVKGVNVVILYPSGKVSPIQEKQLTTLGRNIRALEVEGSFDDCQAMVKKAFLDKELKSRLKLTSANSINVARWMPQMFYFLFAYQTYVDQFDKLAFSVPSGNFGNICAGILAMKLGMPVNAFVAANNENDSVTRYLSTGNFEVKPTIPTISNAMDVGNPSNFIRIQELFGSEEEMKKHLLSYSFSDKQTREAMKELSDLFDYTADPHGAVGYLGAKRFLESRPDHHCICLETAHPAKFPEVVEETLNIELDLPAQLKAVANLAKKSEFIRTYEEMKSALI